MNETSEVRSLEGLDREARSKEKTENLAPSLTDLKTTPPKATPNSRKSKVSLRLFPADREQLILRFPTTKTGYYAVGYEGPDMRVDIQITARHDSDNARIDLWKKRLDPNMPSTNQSFDFPKNKMQEFLPGIFSGKIPEALLDDQKNLRLRPELSRLFFHADSPHGIIEVKAFPDTEGIQFSKMFQQLPEGDILENKVVLPAEWAVAANVFCSILEDFSPRRSGSELSQREGHGSKARE